ncbi:MAG: hypothetical protein QM702_00120 [Rubrivivax sp.]
MIRIVLVRYSLRNGATGALHILAESTCSAIVTVVDLFGEALRTCSACTVTDVCTEAT